jgi:hypothetical protein
VPDKTAIISSRVPRQIDPATRAKIREMAKDIHMRNSLFIKRAKFDRSDEEILLPTSLVLRHPIRLVEGTGFDLAYAKNAIAAIRNLRAG